MAKKTSRGADPVQTEFVKRHDIPDEAIKAAQEYASAMNAKTKATQKFNGKRDNLIAIMREHGIERVPVSVGGVTKLVHVEASDKLKFEVPDEEKTAAA